MIIKDFSSMKFSMNKVGRDIMEQKELLVKFRDNIIHTHTD